MDQIATYIGRHFLRIVSLLVVSLVGRAHAEDLQSRIIGGEFADLKPSSVALILAGDYRCTGVLVGNREILTAAHCVVLPVTIDDYSVLVGGGLYGVSEAWYSGNYDQYTTAALSAPYDLGMLLLDVPVSGAAATPVLNDFPIRAGEQGYIYGYGTNELSGLPGRYPWEDGKVGRIVVVDASNGLLSSKHYLAGASACPGDSGGPAIKVYGGYPAVMGILSVGVNRAYDRTCYLNADGSYSYVDLQSSTSQRFLRNFPGVQYISGYRIYVHVMSVQIAKSLNKARRAKNATVLLKKVGMAVKEIKGLLIFADISQAALLNSARRDLNQVKKARDLAEMKAKLKRARRKVLSVEKMGVY